MAVAYVYLNVGPVAPTAKADTAYVQLNVGIDRTSPFVDTHYIYLSVYEIAPPSLESNYVFDVQAALSMSPLIINHELTINSPALAFNFDYGHEFLVNAPGPVPTIDITHLFEQDSNLDGGAPDLDSTHEFSIPPPPYPDLFINHVLNITFGPELEINHEFNITEEEQTGLWNITQPQTFTPTAPVSTQEALCTFGPDYSGRLELEAKPDLPVGFSKEYRLVFTDVEQSFYQEASDVEIGTITLRLADIGSSKFIVALTDENSQYLNVPNSEIQIYQGNQIRYWGVNVRSKVDLDQNLIESQTKEVPWYFTKRHFGKAGRNNLIVNGNFNLGLKGWWIMREDGAFGFEGVPSNEVTASNELHLIGNRCLRIVNPTPTSGKVNFALQMFEVNGGPTGKLFTAAAWCYVPDNHYQGPGQRDRGMVLARIRSDWQNWPFVGGGVKNLYAANIQWVSTSINERTPRDRWVRHVGQIKVPPNKTEYIGVRLQAPHGVAYWDVARLVWDEALRTPAEGQDQATLFGRIIDHAQDEDYDKSDLNIGKKITKTDVKRTREYLFSEHQNIFEELSVFPTLANGIEWEFQAKPTSRKMVTHYPRRGSIVTSMPLELGKNISEASIMVDGERTANSVVILSDSADDAREEGFATDLDTLGGLVLEGIYNATPGSLPDKLDEQARRALARFKTALNVLDVTVYEDPDDSGRDPVLVWLHPGNIHTVVIKKGWVNIVEQYRIVQVDLNPNESTAKLTLNKFYEDEV